MLRENASCLGCANFLVSSVGDGASISDRFLQTQTVPLGPKAETEASVPRPSDREANVKYGVLENP